MIYVYMYVYKFTTIYITCLKYGALPEIYRNQFSFLQPHHSQEIHGKMRAWIFFQMGNSTTTLRYCRGLEMGAGQQITPNVPAAST